jgi:signal transduction histidine kinase
MGWDSDGRILMLDDPPSCCDAQPALLRQAGFVVFTATLSQARGAFHCGPGLILLWAQPGSGNAAAGLRQIRSASASIPLLAVLPRGSSSEDRAEMLESGADACLTGPVGARELLAMVRSVFERERADFERVAALRGMALALAHELRNPLAISSSAAQFLTQGEVSAEFQRQCVGRVQFGIRRASVVLNILLRLARMELDRKPLPVMLVPVVKRALAVLEEQASQQAVAIKRHFPDAPLTVVADAGVLEQLLLVLLLTALNAMPNGGTLEVTVASRCSEAWIQVSGSPSLTASSEIARLLAPFTASDPGEFEEADPVSVWRSLLKKYDGTIWAERVTETESMVSVKLPIPGSAQ